MKLFFVMFILPFLLFGLAACGAVSRLAPSPTPLGTPDPDSTALLSMSQQALQMAWEDIPDAVIRQVDTNLSVTTFHFTDLAATRLVMITVPRPGAALSDWVVDRNSISPLLGFPSPGLDLALLRAGPRRMAQALTTQWPGCQLRGLTLFLQDSRLTWVGFCLVSEGEVTGELDAQTGVFQPSTAPPARFPVTATPLIP